MSRDRAAGVQGGLLDKRGIDKRRRLPSQPVLLHVPDHAHNLPRAVLFGGIRIVTKTYLLSNRIFVRKELPHECFVHDYRPRGSVSVVLVKEAPLLQRN